MPSQGVIELRERRPSFDEVILAKDDDDFDDFDDEDFDDEFDDDFEEEEEDFLEPDDEFSNFDEDHPDANRPT